MELKLVREIFSYEATFGSLYVNGEYLCKTLEDQARDLDIDDKVYGLTAIPYGKYRVVMYPSKHFGRELPLLLNVPHFSGILIHRGNYASDTDGCILPGESILGTNMIRHSAPCEKRIVELLRAAESAGERSYIEICRE